MDEHAAPAPNSYALTCEIEVRFRDTDAMGHVNNAVYLSYLEMARVRYWRALSGTSDYRQVSFILGEVWVRYKSPTYAGETVVVGVRVRELRGASFDFHYTLWEKTTGRLLAEAKTTQVMYDYRTQKPMRMPNEFRQKITEFEKIGPTRP